MKNIILASTSQYRKEQLQRLNIEFEAIDPSFDETAYKNDIADHTELSRQLALGKARAVASNPKYQHGDPIVIGGDQVASFDGRILSKPLSNENAIKQLIALSGKQHTLITSICVLAGESEYLHTNTATMTMRELSSEQIERYVTIDQPLYCCGAYKLEALGISLFERVECSDYSAIVGIPLMWTAKKLTELGVVVP
jgi:septum formation protein